MAKNVISILGCGWLGLPLAQRLVSLGFAVKGSTTSAEKADLLKESDISPFQIRCLPDMGDSDITDFFNSDILVLTLPFKRNLDDPAFYAKQVQAIVEKVEQSSIKWVIFTSSTSIYPLINAEVAESQGYDTSSDRAEVLHAVEQCLLNNSAFDATVLRLAGLYGGERMIGRILAGRKDVPHGQAPVNLIHLDDCVEMIVQIIAKGPTNDVFNLSSDEHPIREELYTQAAVKAGNTPPEFLKEEKNSFKIISNEKVKQYLSYEFKHPDPMSDCR